MRLVRALVLAGFASATLLLGAGSPARGAAGSTIDGRFAGGGPIAGGVETRLTVAGRGGVPSTAKAVVLNVTVTEPTGSSFLTVWPTGATRPVASNLNFTPGVTVANAVMIGVGSGGQVSFYNNSGDVHVVVDVMGWFGSSSDFRPLTPARIADTRPGFTIDGKFSGTGAVGAGETLELPVLGRAGVPATGVSAVVLNVTAVDATDPSFVTVWPTGDDRPVASNLNAAPGIAVPNLVLAKVGDGGQVSLYNNSGALDLVVDVVGWMASGTGYKPIVPLRIADTRSSKPLLGLVPIDLAVLGRGGLPKSGVDSVALNVTVTEPIGDSYLTVWPADVDQPTSSNLNFVNGQTIANAAVVKVGATGNVSLFTAALSAHVVVDVMGYYPKGASFNGITPARLMDTRQ
jgi:hypothetical protein